MVRSTAPAPSRPAAKRTARRRAWWRPGRRTDRPGRWSGSFPRSVGSRSGGRPTARRRRAAGRSPGSRRPLGVGSRLIRDGDAAGARSGPSRSRRRPPAIAQGHDRHPCSVSLQPTEFGQRLPPVMPSPSGSRRYSVGDTTNFGSLSTAWRATPRWTSRQAPGQAPLRR